MGLLVFRARKTDVVDGLRFWVQHSVLERAGFPRHTHANFGEVMIILKGSARHVINGTPHVAQVGDVYVLKGRDVHGWEDAEGLTLYNVIYDPRWLGSACAELRRSLGYQSLFQVQPSVPGVGPGVGDHESHLRLGRADLDGIGRIVAGMKAEIEAKKSGYHAAVHAGFLHMAVRLCRRAEDTSAVRSEPRGQLALVATYLEEHLGEQVTPGRLAEIARMSETHMFRMFRAAYGTSPLQYQLRARIRRACDLLRDDSLSTTGVAFEVGFSDSNYFARQFKRIMGASPTTYRKHAGPYGAH